MEEIVREGFSLGGEQSGHVIFSDYLFTGDGLATALSVLRVMAATGRTLSSLAGELVTYPQVLVNVRVRERRDLASVPAIAEVMARVESRLVGHGRCWSATRAPSRCCASCSRAATATRSPLGQRDRRGREAELG